jgi:MFS family permease
MCIYYSLNFWYPTFLRDAHRQTLPYLAAFNLGAIAGTATWGRLSEGRLGRRGAFTATIILGVASLPFFLFGTSSGTLIVGALMMGFFGMGIWGMAPAYTVERFPTSFAAWGPGFCYHAGAAMGAAMPTLLGAMQDRGIFRRQRHEHGDGRLGGARDDHGVARSPKRGAACSRRRIRRDAARNAESSGADLYGPRAK